MLWLKRLVYNLSHKTDAFMNGLDLVLGICLLLGAYHGFKKGFIAECIALLLVVLSCIKGVDVYNHYLPYLMDQFPTYGKLWPMVLFIGICLTAGGLIMGLTKILKHILNMTFLGLFDSILGAIWGALKLVILISVLLYGWKILHLPNLFFYTFEDSMLFKLFRKLIPNMLSYWIVLRSLMLFFCGFLAFIGI